MSMLAEHKTRPSWVLNPRASDWSKDQNKLGQKMLEKMGWSAGKGLGAKEQGPVEALRVAHKADVRGLGASRKKEQEYWLQQQESFQSLLENLNGGDAHNVEVKSLEERSKTSKARVHYHKFTRGKDISRYSKKDLSCIVGSGVPAPKVIPAKQQRSEYQLRSSVAGADVLGNPDSGMDPSAPDPDLHSTAELRSLSDQTLGRAAEKSIPAKKKSKKSDIGVGALKAKPLASTDDIVLQQDNEKLDSDHRDTLNHVKDKKKSHKKSDNSTNEVAPPTKKSKRKLPAGAAGGGSPVEHVTSSQVSNDVDQCSKKTRKVKKSKNDVSEVAGLCSSAPVKKSKKKSKKEIRVVEDEIVEKPTKEDEDKEESGGKKKRKKPTVKEEKKKNERTKKGDEGNTETDESRRKSKRKITAEGDDKPEENGGTRKTGKRKKKRKDEETSETHVDPNENLETVPYSLALQEDDETNLSSLNSQSSLINELVESKKQNEVEYIVRPECWYGNHILREDTDEEITSEDERLTGIQKTLRS